MAETARASEAAPAPPESVDAECARCDEETPHRVEKGALVRQGAAVEGTFTCSVCGTTQQGLVEIPVPIEILFHVSEKDRTQQKRVEVLKGEEVRVGDEFEVDDALVEVTAVELPDGRRVPHAAAEDIQTLWGKDITKIEVGFAMNVGSETRAFVSAFAPEDTVRVGDVFEYEGRDVEVYKVVTTAGRRSHGEHAVRDIRRVWIRLVRREKRPPAPSPGRGPPRAGSASRGTRPSPRSPAKRPQRTATKRPAGRSGPPSRGPPRRRR